MAEYINAKIIGVDPVSAAVNVIARSSTGGGASGNQWHLLNIHSLGQFWIHSLSGAPFAALTSDIAYDAANTGYGNSDSTAPGALSSIPRFVAYLKVALDSGQVFSIPLLKSTTA